MIVKRIEKLRKKLSELNIDGYVIPKNDEFFSEYSEIDRLKIISNFSGSAGYAIIFKKRNYLFVDGRYTLQAKIESGKQFDIVKSEKIINCNLFKNLSLGIDPKLFTSSQIEKFFKKFNKIEKIPINLIDEIYKYSSKKTKPFFSLSDQVVGENYKKKIQKISSYLKKNKLDYLFVSAPENVAWLLNIRGYDNPHSPIPNCRLIVDHKKNLYLISTIKKARKLIKEKKIKKKNLINPEKLTHFIQDLRKGKILIDEKSCSIFNEEIFKKKFFVIKKEDPIYLLKSIKNNKEINHMKNCHIQDGIALTKFLYWIKNINKKKITELDAQKKLELFRKKNKDYLFPSFNTIAGTGKNGAIIHYRANKNHTLKIDKKDIFLCDSGGQYKYGTTDVTRTICFKKPNNNIKDIFTKVLKGHIAVVNADLKKYFCGRLIDKLARKNLNQIGLNYEHGTGHGVGFFLNVHEGPQAISKYNNIRIKEGMVLSNEPGFYEKGKFGIRIENLIYARKINNNLFFENLTLAPIEKELINQKLLNSKEKKYLFKYHLDIYSKISKFLNKNEKKWLASFI